MRGPVSFASRIVFKVRAGECSRRQIDPSGQTLRISAALQRCRPIRPINAPSGADCRESPRRRIIIRTSRKAAQECSPRRKAWEKESRKAQLRRSERNATTQTLGETAPPAHCGETFPFWDISANRMSFSVDSQSAPFHTKNLY